MQIIGRLSGIFQNLYVEMLSGDMYSLSHRIHGHKTHAKFYNPIPFSRYLILYVYYIIDIKQFISAVYFIFSKVTSCEC